MLSIRGDCQRQDEEPRIGYPVRGICMATYLRRSLIGLLSGLASSTVLAATMGNVPQAVVLGVVVGIGYAVAFRPVAHAYIDSIMSAASMAVPLWALLNVVIF